MRICDIFTCRLNVIIRLKVSKR